MWLMPKRLHRAAQVADKNCVPLSDVMVSGTPNLAIHEATNASVQTEASMFFNGTASNHLVDLSMMVSR
jgi:hypothetical protein